MMWQLLYQGEVINEKGLFHSMPTVRLAQFQLYSAYALTEPGEERSHKRGDEVPCDLEQWGMAEVCSQVVPDMNLWNLGQGNSSFHSRYGDLRGQESPPTGTLPFSGEQNGETDTWVCLFTIGSDWTFSEHRTEHTAVIPRDWPATLTRSPTADCSGQLRVQKSKEEKTDRLEKENKPPVGRMMITATERSIFISFSKKEETESLWDAIKQNTCCKGLSRHLCQSTCIAASYLCEFFKDQIPEPCNQNTFFANVINTAIQEHSFCDLIRRVTAH